MASLFKWYLACLKSHPMTANGITAAVLMTTGDVAAQEIEFAQEAQAESQQQEHCTTTTTCSRIRRKETIQHSNSFGFFHERINGAEKQQPVPVLNTSQTSQAQHVNNEDPESGLDVFRSAMMAGWGVFLLTPFYVTLFRWYERNLPANRTVAGVLSRVGMSYVTSVPVNLVFFAYGTMAHHTADWTAQVWEQCSRKREAFVLLGEQDQDEQQDKRLGPALELLRVSTVLATSASAHNPSATAYTASPTDLPPFDWEEAWSKIVQKWQAEMVYTQTSAATFWIPFNSINFSLVPVHLRPLTQCGAGVAWNCFLSLAQHR